MARVQALSFTKSWENREDFPTYEDNEERVRADMQYLFDEIRDYLNRRLLPAVNAIAAVEVTAASGGTVQGALNALRADLEQAVLGNVPDGSITPAKLAPEAKLQDRTAAVTLTPDPNCMENRPEANLRFYHAPTLGLVFVQGTVTLQRVSLGDTGYHARYHFDTLLPDALLVPLAAQSTSGTAAVMAEFSASDGALDIQVLDVPASVPSVTVAVSGWYALGEDAA